VYQDQTRVIYVQRQHGPFRGLLTFVLAIWAFAYPVLLLLLTPLGPIGFVLGIAAAIFLFVPWVAGLLIIGAIRWFA
jgi:hypothetical protein